jgi:hypothetical protein
VSIKIFLRAGGTGIGGNGNSDSWFDFDNTDGGGASGGSGISGAGDGGASGNENQGEDGIIPSEISTVPEPSTLALLTLGLIGLSIARKSAQKQSG